MTNKERAIDFVSRWLRDSSGFHVGLSDGNTEPDYNDLVDRVAALLDARSNPISQANDDCKITTVPDHGLAHVQRTREFIGIGAIGPKAEYIHGSRSSAESRR
jgi:hypothetical protein